MTHKTEKKQAPQVPSQITLLVPRSYTLQPMHNQVRCIGPPLPRLSIGIIGFVASELSQGTTLVGVLTFQMLL